LGWRSWHASARAALTGPEGASGRIASAVSGMLEALERLAHDHEVRCGDRVLDHGEQLALLESDVLGDALGQFVKDVWFGASSRAWRRIST
jgi:hypothetical protein